MTVFNFPDTTGQPIDGSFTWTAPSGVLYVWNGEAWVTQGSGGSSGGGSKVYVTDDLTTIDDPEVGDLAYHTVEARLYVYYQDSDSQQWVDASPAGDAADAGGDSLWERGSQVTGALTPAFTTDDLWVNGYILSGETVYARDGGTSGKVFVGQGDDVDNTEVFSVTNTGDLSAADGTFSTRVRAVSGNSYAEISHADGLTMVDSNVTKANITLDGSATFARFVSSPAINCEPDSRYATNTASFKQPTNSTNADIVLRLQHEGASDGYLLLGGDSAFTTPANARFIIKADGSAEYGPNNYKTQIITGGSGVTRAATIILNKADAETNVTAISLKAGGSQTGQIKYNGSATFFLAPEDPANFNAEGEYTGPTLDVKDRLLNLISRLDALEANEVIDDATDTSLLTLLANASTRLDSIEARLTALEGGN